MASFYFYMSVIPIYFFLISAVILINYFTGIFISKSAGRKKRFYLILGILLTGSIFFVFKYFNFFNANVAQLASLLHWNYSINSLSLVLPIGLSFYTFQSLSYIIDVYRKDQKVERHLGIYSLYVIFYPQLVAGPIERSYNLLPQFYKEQKFEYNRLLQGLQIMVWGFFLKVVIADRAASIVNLIYNNVQSYSGVPLILATYIFSFQIFCDFAGYSFIAIGCAKIMGFDLMNNFKRPYFAKSIKEFWRRWHISLSTWFKDYVYVPLGGNKVNKKRLILNLLIVFLISGLWHGAAWTFLIWGGLHGCYMIFFLLTGNYWKKLSKKIGLAKFPKIKDLIRILTTFTLVTFAWIFFRANSLSDARYIITHLFSNINLEFLTNPALMGGRINLLLIFIFILFLEIVNYIQEKKGIRKTFYKFPTLVRLLIYILFILIILLFGIFGGTKFIYFQF